MLCLGLRGLGEAVMKGLVAGLGAVSARVTAGFPHDIVIGVFGAAADLSVRVTSRERDAGCTGRNTADQIASRPHRVFLLGVLMK
jgi:hypothetical protein